MKTFTVHFYYIDNGKDDTEDVQVDERDERPIEDIVAEAWRGLTSSSGGLRKVTSIKEKEKAKHPCSRCQVDQVDGNGEFNPCICYAR